MDITDDPLAGVDADELEADIDKAIDELFVKKGKAPEPSIAEEAPPKESVPEPREEPAEEPVLETPAEPEVDSLGPLKESLLTLDWEISAANIESFEKELQAVNEMVSDDRHSTALIKMSLGVLQYLRAAKASATPISVQFLHAATRGLELFLREPPPTEGERTQVMDKLLGQFRRVKAEIQRLRPAEDLPVEEPVPEEISAEEPVLEEIHPEEPPLEELIEEEPILEEISAEEPVLEEIHPEEPPLEELIEEEPTPVEPPGEEPTLEAFPAEEPTLEEISEEEIVFEPPPEEEPSLEELFAEEPTPVEPPEEEPTLEALPAEEPILEEISEEVPVLEPSLEPTEIAPAARADIPAPLQQFTQEARKQNRQLTDALDELTQETSNFFGRILRVMSGKPALGKVEKHFDVVHRSMQDKLTTARELSRNLAEVLTKLEQSLGQQQGEALDPESQAEIDSQVRTIHDAVEKFSQAATKLQKSLGGLPVGPTPGRESIASRDTGEDTAEFAFESEETMESLGSEPLLELVEEAPPEPSLGAPPAEATIYLADVANNTLGIPTEVVTNAFKVSKGKVKSFRKRGYVRLADFKALFRSIKKGVTGPLADLKVKDLKKIQFPIITLSPETLGSDDSDAIAPARGIVLLSNGERHGALFTDEVIQKTPYEVKGYRKAGLAGEVSGAATIEGDFEINLIDPDYVLP
ncbi:MAG: hypothetical protein PVF76_02905 [Syntrophobacterales bacterium]|jgi:hypothetical protein